MTGVEVRLSYRTEAICVSPEELGDTCVLQDRIML